MIRAGCQLSVGSSLKRVRSFPKTDDSVTKWFYGQQSQGIPVSNSRVLMMAKYFSVKMNEYGFKASYGWLKSWKRRHGIIINTAPAIGESTDGFFSNSKPQPVGECSSGAGAADFASPIISIIKEEHHDLNFEFEESEATEIDGAFGYKFREAAAASTSSASDSDPFENVKCELVEFENSNSTASDDQFVTISELGPSTIEIKVECSSSSQHNNDSDLLVQPKIEYFDGSNSDSSEEDYNSNPLDTTIVKTESVEPSIHSTEKKSEKSQYSHKKTTKNEYLYSSTGLFTFPDRLTDVEDEDTVDTPLESWLNREKLKIATNTGPPETINVISLEPDPTIDNVGPISTDNPISCKLCSRKLTSILKVKIHVKHCWLRNKKRHRFCVWCKNIFQSPSILKKHHCRVLGEGFKKPNWNQKYYYCRLCPRKFKVQNSLGGHMQWHNRRSKISGGRP